MGYGLRNESGRCRPHVVESEEPLKNLVVGHVDGPAIGGEDGCIESAVGVGEPGGALVVQVRERALGQAGSGGGVAGDETRVLHGADLECAAVDDRRGVYVSVPWT